MTQNKSLGPSNGIRKDRKRQGPSWFFYPHRHAEYAIPILQFAADPSAPPLLPWLRSYILCDLHNAIGMLHVRLQRFERTEAELRESNRR